jgi:two-component system, NtrC family, response regulator HydG
VYLSWSNRILIVDDEAALRTSLAANLALEGYKVVEAEDGARAIELVREGSFDLIISDVRMPGMNGVDAFREIRKIRPGLPVILMTAFAVEDLLAEALAEGVYAVLPKPFDIARLIGLIARVVAGPVVLVVEHVPDHAKAIVTALRSVGIEAATARDGRAALRFVRMENVDVCVLDLVMPGLNGVKVCEEMRRLDPSIRVIAMSDDAATGITQALMSMGGYTCLRKPVEMPELTRAIGRARGGAVG